MYGFLVSLQYTGMNSLAYASLAEEDLSSATAIMSTTQQLAQSFGVAVAAIIVNIYASNFSVNHGLSLQVFHQTFVTLGILTMLSIVIFMGLRSDDGHELIEVVTAKISS